MTDSCQLTADSCQLRGKRLHFARVQADIDEILQGFPREVPVFPLGGVVLFPGAVLPLVIFEERYKQMLTDVLDKDRVISLALLKQCSKEEYEREPPFHETVCVGQIIHHESLPDGRYSIALLGLSAGRAVAAKSDKPYRIADIELLEDSFDAKAADEAKLERAFRGSVPGPNDLAALRNQLAQFLTTDHIPAAVINTCALTAPVFPVHKLELLEERSLARRLDRLLEFLERPWQWN